MTRSANFVEETTTSIAGTGGNGSVTLTAIASTPRFSTVFGTQATTVRYVIENTTTKAWEVGIGSVAAHVLTRTRPQVTWDGTTYDDSTPAPIAFGSTPASGNIKVRLSATAETVSNEAAGYNTNLFGAGSLWQEFRPSAHMPFDQGGLSAPTIDVNVEQYTAYRVSTAGSLTGIRLDVTTAAASNIKLALYPIGVNGMPGQKILDFNQLGGSTTGAKTDTATGTWSPAGPVWLTPGWYAIGFIVGAAVGLRGATSAALKVGQTPFGHHGGYGYCNTVGKPGSFATGLPALPAPDYMISAADLRSVPFIGLRIVS